MKRIRSNISMLAFIMVSLLLVATSCDKDNDVALTAITLDKTSSNVGLAQTLTLTATLVPLDATSKELTWTSDDASVATVVDGVVTGVKIGKTTITVASKSNSVIKAICLVEVVYPVNLTGIALNKASTIIETTKTETLTVVYTPSDATAKDVTWASDNTAVATVANGVVTAVAAGKANLTATSVAYPTLKSTCAVEIISTTISGDITTNQTWHKEYRYKLSGFVYVKNNAVLTIEPGTIIQGISGTKAALMIERGSKIMAEGTAEKPIIFTSDKPKGQRNYGDWGGLVLLGRAKTNKHDNGTGVGVAEGGIGSEYGGVEDNDNSGILKYVRVEFAGIALTSVANSEINGLTLYAVGRGTTIDHVQVSYSGDDSYEWFGGTVNCKYLVAWRGWDDDFDTDNGFSGTVQFILSARDGAQLGDQSGSNGFESDNDADGSLLTPVTHPIFSNATVYGPLASAATLQANHLWKRSMHIRRSSQTSVYNSVFIGWPKGLLIDGEKGNTPVKADDNTFQIENCLLGGMTANYEASTAVTQANPYTLTQVQNYYELPARNNTKSTLVEAMGSTLLSLTTPNLLPGANTFYTNASFLNSNLSSNTFLDKTPTYKGAFGSTNWTSGWCNFDPQNADY